MSEQAVITATRICPICEAACGLKVSLADQQVIAIEPNRDDVFSRGHACAKGLALKQLDEDTARLRKPLVKRQGVFEETSWEDAFALIQTRLKTIRAEHGPQSLASYIGNPTAHNIGLSMGMGSFLGMLGSVNIYSAASVDQLPKQLASELMFGQDMAIPVPDIERTDYLLMLGANPVVSNGSLWMVPKFRDHLREMQGRGGRLVTVDPRRSETARVADAHHFIRPGADAWLLAALINELQQLGVTMPDSYQVSGWQTLRQALAEISTSEAAQRTGITIEAIKLMASEMLAAKRPAVYGRVGTTLQRFGTLTSFLIETLNLLNGSLDQEGGAMFPEQPFQGAPDHSQGPQYNRYQTRVSGFPEILGQFPVAALAEEMLTPGDGQIRALFTFAGNPVVSGPESGRMEAALQGLDLMVSVDIYLNETTRYADVILPGTSPFQEGHYDSFLGSLGYRNAARYTPPLVNTGSSDKREWDIGLTLAYLLNTDAPPTPAELQAFEDNLVASTITQYTDDPASPLSGRDVQEILGQLPDSGAERLLDLGIRAGRWGDGFGKDPDGLTLQKMIDHPDGIDLGSLRGERLSELLGTNDGHIQLAPDLILSELQRLPDDPLTEGLLLIGRRSVSTNNSWLHNLSMLNRGSRVCVLEVNHQDAQQLQLEDGDNAALQTDVGEVIVTVKVTENLVSGVVSLPHGFSEVAEVLGSQTKGPNYNAVVSRSAVDIPSGTSALNGVPVMLEPVRQ